MKKVLGFSLIEIMIVVTIIAIASTMGVSAWRYGMVKAEFDDTVTDIITVFQTARSYALKSIEIDGDLNTTYMVIYDPDGEDILFRGDDPDVITEYNFGDTEEEGKQNYNGIVDIGTDPWSITYEVPYAYATTWDGNDITITVTSQKWDLEKQITVHNLSGIAETVE